MPAVSEMGKAEIVLILNGNIAKFRRKKKKFRSILASESFYAGNRAHEVQCDLGFAPTGAKRRPESPSRILA